MASPIGASLPLAALLALVLVGCERSELAPSSRASDVHAAEQKEQSKTERALENASQDVGKAQQRVEEKAADRDDIAAKDAYKVAMAKADRRARRRHSALPRSSRAMRRAAASDRQTLTTIETKADAKALEVSRTR